MRRTLILLALVVAGSTFAWGQSGCIGTNLKVTRVSDDAGAGQRSVTFAFTNTSYRPCTLKGYPGFTLLTNRGGRLSGIHIVRTTDPADVVTLAPGGKAWFDIKYSSCQVVGDPPCRISSKVRITPPRSSRAFIRRERLDPFNGKVNLSPVRNVEGL